MNRCIALAFFAAVVVVGLLGQPLGRVTGLAITPSISTLRSTNDAPFDSLTRSRRQVPPSHAAGWPADPLLAAAPEHDDAPTTRPLRRAAAPLRLAFQIRQALACVGLAGLSLVAMALAASRRAQTPQVTYAISMFSVTGDGEKPQKQLLQPEEEEEEPIWIRRERERATAPQEVPFWAFLLFSTIVGIAAVGSIFEYINGNPIFGVITKDSPFWAPILWWLILTGFPLSAYLFTRAVSVANKVAENMDKMDGY